MKLLLSEYNTWALYLPISFIVDKVDLKY